MRRHFYRTAYDIFYGDETKKDAIDLFLLHGCTMHEQGERPRARALLPSSDFLEGFLFEISLDRLFFFCFFYFNNPCTAYEIYIYGGEFTLRP